MKIRKAIIPLGGLIASSCGAQSPNVVYVFPDQFRNCSMNFWNDPEYAEAHQWKADPSVTPRLREFASEAVVLSQAMSNCPISSPYRGIFLSGMYPERSGIMNNCMSLRPTSTLSDDAECISDLFSANGYDCAYIGKLHATFPTANNPQNPGTYVDRRWPAWDAYTSPEHRHGFNYWYSYGTYDVHRAPHYWDTEGNFHEVKEHSAKHEVDKAIEFLRNKGKQRSSRKPFFLCIGMNPPHSPYQSFKDCMEEDFNLYKDMTLSELYVRANADTTMRKARSMRYYLANVTAVDREFGRLMDELKALGLDKNTIVIFTSDHGETMCSHSVQDPKNSIWTESFNVPFMVRFPGKLEHHISNALLSTIDIMPTILSMCGLGDKIPQTAEGRDLSNTLKGNEAGPESVLYIRNLDGDTDENQMVLNYFPEARGLKTADYTFEVSINRDYSLKDMVAFDDHADPYQLSPIRMEQNKDLINGLKKMLRDKLQEANDMWATKGISEIILQ